LYLSNISEVLLGAFSGVVTPVPISNTEVKDSSGDDCI